jgi:hypothetical protein
MKEIAIFGSYCNTKEKLQALENSIKGAKDIGLDVMVFGRYPLPEKVQLQCDYWIFDKSNPVLEDRALNHYFYIHDKYISNWFYDYGYAALEQITKTLGFAKSLNYDIAYWLVYDVNTSGLGEFRKVCLDKLQTHHSVCHHFVRDSYQKPQGLDGTSIGFKIQIAYDKLKGTITETFYRDLISRKENFISEDFMEECFRISELNYYLMPIKPDLKATLTSTGVRKHGDIPHIFPQTLKYFTKCNIGWDEDNKCPNIFIWNIKQPINYMVIDLGNKIINYTSDINLRIDGNVEFLLEEKPLKFEIKAINEVVINETLDPEFTELYWNLFKIKIKD